MKVLQPYLCWLVGAGLGGLVMFLVMKDSNRMLSVKYGQLEVLVGALAQHTVSPAKP